MSNSAKYTLPGGIDLGALPKVSLHDHLDGGLRPQTILDLAAAIDCTHAATRLDGIARFRFFFASALAKHRRTHQQHRGHR